MVNRINYGVIAVATAAHFQFPFYT